MIQEEENYVPKAFRKKRAKKKKRKLKKFIILICFVIIIILSILLGISSHTWKTLAKEMLINENSVVIDLDGNNIAKLGCERKNITTNLENIPNNIKNAYVAIEDERFYSHSGIDIKRTGAAILSYVFHL